MVTQPIRTEPVDTDASAPAQAGQFLPRRSQPWTLASLLVGIPGAFVCAVLTTVATFYVARGDGLLGVTLMAGALVAWFTVMTVLWVGRD